jgi:glycosyltransferase involved in cell wall biosynthesis
MNVCMISYSVYEADGRVMRYAETLARRGDTVDVVALSRGGQRSADEIINGVNVFRVRPRTHDEKGKFSYLFRILAFFFRAMLFATWRGCKTRYDFVHVHSVPDFLVFAAWLPKLRGAKIILDIHDVLPELYASKFDVKVDSTIFKLLLMEERSSAAFADHVIAANHIWQDKLVARAVQSDKCTAILNFPDFSIFRPRGRTRADGKFVMIYPGTLNWHQGLDIAVRSFAQIKDLAPEAEFHIYGVGPAEASLEKLTEELGLGGRVKLLGPRKLGDVAELMENADLGIVPKRNDAFGGEAFSTKILEFMAMGVPVLVSDTKIDRYYFNDSVVRFFPASDESGLAKEMLNLIKDPQLRCDLAKKAIEFVKDYDWETNQSKYLDILKNFNIPSLSRPTVVDARLTRGSGAHLMNCSLAQYYRCPERYVPLHVKGSPSSKNGYFEFGKDTVCYGKYYGGAPSASATGTLPDGLQDVETQGGVTCLPFDVEQVVDSLRLEVYATDARNGGSSFQSAVASIYYFVRPVLPVGIRKYLQKVRLSNWDQLPFPKWPVDTTVDNIFEQLILLSLRSQKLDRIPFIWFWPDGASSCAVMTHDVETAQGRDFCSTLMDINDSFGIKASFQVVPERRYEVSASYLDSIRDRGFEVNVQDLNHDGHLFRNRERFIERAKKINFYGQQYGAAGFRSAVLYRKQEWFDELQFSYDTSVPNVAHLDPQRGGCCTVMPYFVGRMLELPVTTTQDYSLFHILNDYTINLWKQQTALIMEKHGLMNFIVHPDYITEAPERKVYEDLLAYLASLRSKNGVWIPTPREANSWWRERAQMQLVADGKQWRIEGTGKERARIAYASERDGRLVYTLEPGLALDVSQASAGSHHS